MGSFEKFKDSNTELKWAKLLYDQKAGIYYPDMKKGDRIITKSGIHGKIMELNDKNNTCIVETMAGKLKIERSAISLEMSSKLNAPPAIK